jgi:predicted flap endonuclease-1-like 5' DNA nuclease
MRSDYALYTVAIIFFIITGIVFASQIEEGYKSLGIITTAILGLFFIGLGYTQRPKPKVQTAVAAPPTPPSIQPMAQAPPPSPPSPTTVVTAEEKVVEMEALAGTPLTEVKGVGEKRAEQLKALGINNVEELAKASAKELASKLKISPKITQKWIENAKKLTEKKS